VEKPSSPESARRWGFRRPRRLRSIALLPTLITLGNGVAGVVAVMKIGQGLDGEPNRAVYFHQAAWCILAGMVFDALDGFVARMTRTTSAFGAQLDSLCDLITFGVAPAFLTFALTRDVQGFWARPVQIVCVLYAMCALIRLARFTVETTPDESAHREFAGLPSPAAAGVVAAAVLPSRFLQAEAPRVLELINTSLPGLALAAGILMVSRVRYVHLVNKMLRGRRPFVTLIEVALVAALVYQFQEFAFFLAFFAYAVSGPALWIKRRFLRGRGSPEAVPADRSGRT
jgi:CDP-diacylglycerol--serine O-phosphatidyltransferase